MRFRFSGVIKTLLIVLDTKHLQLAQPVYYGDLNVTKWY